MSKHTEKLVHFFRHEYGNPSNANPGMVVEALLDLAGQRDELVAACEALIAYRDKVGPLSFQLEKADDYIRMMRVAMEKTRPADG